MSVFLKVAASLSFEVANNEIGGVGGGWGVKPPGFGSSYLIILLYTCILRGGYPNICIHALKPSPAISPPPLQTCLHPCNVHVRIFQAEIIHIL